MEYTIPKERYVCNLCDAVSIFYTAGTPRASEAKKDQRHICRSLRKSAATLARRAVAPSFLRVTIYNRPACGWCDIQVHVKGVKFADKWDAGRNKTVVEMLKEHVFIHEIKADKAVDLSNDWQPLCLGKNKPWPQHASCQCRRDECEEPPCRGSRWTLENSNSTAV
eukprot:6180843-Pleurochrysis_carterae.AAC.1